MHLLLRLFLSIVAICCVVGCNTEPKGNTEISAEQRARQLTWNASQALDDLAPLATARASVTPAVEADVALLPYDRTDWVQTASAQSGFRGLARYPIYGTTTEYGVGVFSATEGPASNRIATTFLSWRGQGNDSDQCFLMWKSQGRPWIVFGDCGDDEAFVCNVDKADRVSCTFGGSDGDNKWCDVSLPLIECSDPGYTERHASSGSTSYNDGYYSGGEYVEWCDGDCGDSSGWTDDSQEPETSDPSNDESTDSEPTDPGDDDSDYTDPDDADDDDEG